MSCNHYNRLERISLTGCNENTGKKMSRFVVERKETGKKGSGWLVESWFPWLLERS